MTESKVLKEWLSRYDCMTRSFHIRLAVSPEEINNIINGSVPVTVQQYNFVNMLFNVPPIGRCVKVPDEDIIVFESRCKKILTKDGKRFKRKYRKLIELAKTLSKPMPSACIHQCCCTDEMQGVYKDYIYCFCIVALVTLIPIIGIAILIKT